MPTTFQQRSHQLSLWWFHLQFGAAKCHPSFAFPSLKFFFIDFRFTSLDFATSKTDNFDWLLIYPVPSNWVTSWVARHCQLLNARLGSILIHYLDSWVDISEFFMECSRKIFFSNTIFRYILSSLWTCVNFAWWHGDDFKQHFGFYILLFLWISFWEWIFRFIISFVSQTFFKYIIFQCFSPYKGMLTCVNFAL